MGKYLRPAGTVATIGAIALAFGWMTDNLPAAIAQEQPMKTLMSSASELFPGGFDPANLLRINDKAYSVTAEEGYSLKPISERVVRKIGYGKTTMVKITTTSSGVYSSDALTSAHIQYPGINVDQVFPPRGHFWNSISTWGGNSGWVGAPSVNANSFTVITRSGNSTVVLHSHG